MRERIPSPTGGGGDGVTPGMLVETARKDLRLRAAAIGGAGGYVPYGFAGRHVRGAVSPREVILNASLEIEIGVKARSWQRRALYSAGAEVFRAAIELCAERK